MDILKKNQTGSHYQTLVEQTIGMYTNTKDRMVCDLFGYHQIVIPTILGKIC